MIAATGSLLYRQRTTDPRRRPTDRVIVLDTSPATFGPVEVILRLVAHLVTTTLRRAGACATLLTPERPDTPIPLATDRDLVHLWTSRTLARPDLAALAETAIGYGHPVIVLTHHETAATAGLTSRPDPLTALLTSHTPSTKEPHPTAAHHHHLATTATADEIEAAVRLLLSET